VQSGAERLEHDASDRLEGHQHGHVPLGGPRPPEPYRLG
jgi:hypothetical protein